MDDPSTPAEPAPPSVPSSGSRERWRAAKASAIGLQFALSIALGAWGGNWIDTRFGTAPYGIMVGLLLGAAAGFRDLYRLARDASKDA